MMDANVVIWLSMIVQAWWAIMVILDITATFEQGA